jgi:hypothetical protein
MDHHFLITKHSAKLLKLTLTEEDFKNIRDNSMKTKTKNKEKLNKDLN